MIEAFTYHKKLNRTESLDDINPCKQKVWVILRDPTPEEIAKVKEKFNIHPTTAEDMVSPNTRIKYEEFENNTFMVYKGIKEIKSMTITFYTIFFIDGDGYVITAYHDKNDTIENLMNNPKKVESLLKKGEDYIVHNILDREVDKYVDIRVEISDDLKGIEEEFMKKPTKFVFQELFLKEKVILEIRQRIDSITDVCLRLMKPSENFIQNDLIPYFRDVYDHTYKVSEALKTYHERINGLRNTYISLNSNRMNETMRALTIIMAIMTPLNIITGFFGMNVPLPLQSHPLTYIFLIGFMILVSVLFLFAFRRIGLFGDNEY
jgi:magnesium transporter